MTVLGEWMDVAAVAAHFQVCTRTVRNWAARMGGRLRIDRAAIRRFEHEFLTPTDVESEVHKARLKRVKSMSRGKDGRFHKDPRNSKRLRRNVKTEA